MEKENSVQIGKVITFFLVALFLNYFLWVFFDKSVLYLTNLYTNFVGNSPFADPMVTTFVTLLLYMIYILWYAIMSNIILSKFVGVNKGFTYFHLNILLSILLIFALFFVKKELGQLLISKFLLALPFISIAGIAIYWLIHGKLHLFDVDGKDGSIFGERSILKEGGNSEPNYVGQWEGKGFFASLFGLGDMKEDFNKAVGKDERVGSHTGEDFRYPASNETFWNQEIHSEKWPLPLDFNKLGQDSSIPVFTRPSENGTAFVWNNEEGAVSVDDITSILNANSETIPEDELIADDVEKIVTSTIENMEASDLQKLLKEESKKMANKDGIEEGAINFEDFTLDQTPKKVNVSSAGTINLDDVASLDNSLGDMGMMSSEDSESPVIDLNDKEAIKRAGGLSAMVNAMQQNNGGVEEKKQEDTVLDNLDKVFFRWFAEGTTWDEQIERLYKLL